MGTAIVNVGDLAVIEWNGRTLASVVVLVHDYPHLGETVYEVDAVGPGFVCVGPEQIRPAPRPAPGQRWVSPDGRHRLVVLEVERGGLFATCRTDKGDADRFVLIGHYRPEG